MDRFAREDTRLERGVLNENIDVSGPGRFYPEEYSSAIGMFQRSTQPLSEIPKSLANIVEQHNDFKINTWMNDQELRITEEARDIEMDARHREQELQLATSNRVYERQLEYEDEIDKALVEAEQTGELATDAIARVAGEFQHQDDFRSIPEANQMWTNTFQRVTSGKFASARKSDRDREVYMAQYNVQNIVARHLPDIMQGRVNPVEMMNNALPDMASFLQTLPVEEKQKQVDNLWSLAVQERGRYVVDQVAQGQLKASDGMTLLRGLLDESVTMSFDALDVNGKQILDKDGKPSQINVTLTPQVQEWLFQTLRDMKNGGGSEAADGFLIDQKKEFNAALGRDEIDATGFTSQVFKYSTVKDLDDFYGSQLAFVANSNAGDKTKADAATEMTQTYARARTVLAVGALAKRSKGYTAQLINDWCNKLSTDLNNPNINWTEYSLTVGKDGAEFELVAPGVLREAPILGEAGLAARNYYKEVLPTLQKMRDKLNNGSMTDLLYHIDKDYYNTATDLSNTISTSNLLKGNAQNGYGLNPEAVQEISSLARTLGDIANSYGVGDEVIAGGIIDSLVANINDKEKGFKTGYETLMGAKAIVSGFSNAGRTLDIAEYARTHSGSGQAGGMLMSALILVDNINDPVAAKLEDAMKRRVTDPSSIPQSDIVERRTELLRDNHVPKAHEGWWAHLSGACKDMAAIDGGNQKDYERTFTDLIKKEYVDLGRGHKVQSAFFKHSPQMKVYSGADGEKRLKTDLDTHNKQLENMAKKLGLPKSTYSNWTWYSDDANKCIRLTKGAVGFMTQNTAGGETFAGVLYNNDEIKNIDPEVRASLFAASLGANLISTDKAVRDKAGDQQLRMLGRNFPESEEARPEVLHIRKVKDLYANPDRDMQRDALLIRRTLDNPTTFVELCKKSANQNKSKGAIQAYTTKNPTLNFLFGTTNMDIPTEAQNTSLQLRKEGATGFAAPVDYASLIQAETSYAGKIKQSDISVPIALAAVGEDKYIDTYNVAQAGGYTIDEVSIPGVTMSTEYDGPTGMAAPIMTRDKAPVATGKKATPQEIDELINQAADVWGIDRKLARALVKQESGGQQYIKSKAGATGLGQLMPATAKSLGVTDSTDAAQNIWGSMKYLNAQLKQFGGSVPLALAAYNAGPGAVSKAKGVPNYAETKNYVKNICRMAGIDYTDATYPVTMSINDSKMKFIDADTGMLSRKGMNDFVYLLNNSETYRGRVASVATNRKELLENKPEYIDFKKYRDMKTPEGKPLFVKGEYDGFKINFKKENSGQFNVAAIPALADDAAKTQTDAIPQLSRDDIEALISTFGSRYNTSLLKRGDGKFGLATLTGEEYESYGVPVSVMQNPMMQARVLTQEFQRAKDILGSDRKAIFALAGGDIRDDQGNIKSWAEVKKDKENFTKNWFIQPSNDARIREEVNALVALYNAERRRIRGV